MLKIRVDDGLVVYLPHESRFVDLNASAEDAWETLRFNDWSIALTADLFQSKYGLPPALALSTTMRVVELLRAEGLCPVESASPPIGGVREPNE